MSQTLRMFEAVGMKRNDASSMTGKVKRRWRFYETSSGRKPAKDFINALADADAASIVAAMKDVQNNGKRVAKPLQDDIWEVKAHGTTETFRILFSAEGEKERVLLALEGFSKKTQKTPPETIRLAKRRLNEWRQRS